MQNIVYFLTQLGILRLTQLLANIFYVTNAFVLPPTSMSLQMHLRYKQKRVFNSKKSLKMKREEFKYDLQQLMKNN